MTRAGIKTSARASPLGLLAAVSDVLGAVQAGLDYSTTKIRTATTREEIALREKKLMVKRDELKEAVSLAARELGLQQVPQDLARRLIDLAAGLVQDATGWLYALLEEDIPDREQLERVQEMLEDAWEQLSASLIGWKELGGKSNGQNQSA